MKRLGYTRFAAQGGDWGGLVVDQMGLQAPPELIGIHTNQPGAVPVDVSEAVQSGRPAPSGLSDEERDRYEKLKDFFATEVAYALEMGTRPQTLYGIADSPVGRAAWMLDHDMVSYGMIARVFDGQAEGLTRDDVLDNVTHYWLTNTGISAARLYWENKLGFFDVKGVSIPVAVSVFPDEIDAAPRSWVERAYPKLIHYNKLDKRRALRGMGAAGALHRRGAHGLPVASLGNRVRTYAHALARWGGRRAARARGPRGFLDADVHQPAQCLHSRGSSARCPLRPLLAEPPSSPLVDLDVIGKRLPGPRLTGGVVEPLARLPRHQDA